MVTQARDTSNSNFSQVSQCKGLTITGKQSHKNSNASTEMLFIYAVKAKVTFRQLLPTEKAAR